jgi:hypothetical protein
MRPIHVILLACIAVAAGGALEGDDGRKLIVPVIAAGLANRLRLVASALQLAQDAQRELWVLWEPGRSCNATWATLFGGTPAFRLVNTAADRDWVLSMIEYDPTLTVTVDVLPRGPPPPLVATVVVTRNLLQSVATEVVFAPEHRTVLLLPSSGLFFKRRSQPCGDYYLRKSAWYRALAAAVIPRLAAVVARVVHSPLLGGGVVVGVHARATDKIFDGAEIGGRYHEDVAPVQRFVEVMGAVARHRAALQKVSVLLCTVTFHANLAHSLTRSP